MNVCHLDGNRKIELRSVTSLLFVIAAVLGLALMPSTASAATNDDNQVLADVGSVASGRSTAAYYDAEQEALEGCVALYVEGSYLSSDAEALLSRVNAIRTEAHNEGISVDGSVVSGSALQWSPILERIAQIRAVEASVAAGHYRPSGSDVFSMSCFPGGAGGENLAWSYSASSGLELWYEEKSIYVSGGSGETGHYTNMISDNYAYVGIGAFRPAGSNYVTVCAVFSDGTGNSEVCPDGTCYQGINVYTDFIDATLTCPDVVARGTTVGVSVSVSVYSDFAQVFSIPLGLATGNYRIVDISADDLAVIGASLGTTAVHLGQITAEDRFEVLDSRDVEVCLFYDISDDAWYAGRVEQAVDLGIMNGEKANGQLTGYFRPESQITRAEVATVLFRIANPDSTATSDPSDYAQSSSFPDVQGGRYYTAAIEWCAESGVVTGYKDGTGEFRPDNCVTRQELATMVWRFCAHMKVDTAVDNPSAFDSMLGTGEVAHWSLEAMRWCASEGIITGVRDDDVLYCQPEGTATRAMAAKVFVVTSNIIAQPK